MGRRVIASSKTEQDGWRIHYKMVCYGTTAGKKPFSSRMAIIVTVCGNTACRYLQHIIAASVHRIVQGAQNRTCVRSLPQERECSGNTVMDVLPTLMSHDRESPCEQKRLSSGCILEFTQGFRNIARPCQYCLCCESFVKTRHGNMLLLLWISHITDFEGKEKSRFVSCARPGWCSAVIPLITGETSLYSPSVFPSRCVHVLASAARPSNAYSELVGVRGHAASSLWAFRGLLVNLFGFSRQGFFV